MANSEKKCLRVMLIRAMSGVLTSITPTNTTERAERVHPKPIEVNSNRQ